METSKGVSLHSGEIFFLTNCKTKTLYIYETKSKILRAILQFQHGPLGVAVSSNGTSIFVSSNDNRISLVDIATGRNESTIRMNCYDVDYFNGCLFGSSYPLKMVSWGEPDNPTFKQFHVDMHLYCITASYEAITCTNFDRNVVLCFGYKGESKWQYRNAELKSPIGITSTASGIVF